MHRIGIVQGRLSPLVNGKIQTFPLAYWEDEFRMADECGISIIEWVLDMTDIDKNPLLSSDGRKHINALRKKYKVDVPSVCADYFIERPFTSEDKDISTRSRQMLIDLVNICPEVGIEFIECPLMGASSIKDEKKEEIIKKIFTEQLNTLKKNNVKLLLEVDLPSDRIKQLLSDINSDYVKINYDMGNSAYWSFDVEEEIKSYGSHIANIHVKDCTPKDYSVSLGKGNVRFERAFELLRDIKYKGDFILQAARGEDHKDTILKYKEFTQKLIERFLNGIKS
jgi:hexulose-6-phosphate isomerase